MDRGYYWVNLQSTAGDAHSGETRQFKLTLPLGAVRVEDYAKIIDQDYGKIIDLWSVG
jgi:hypothetical protein